LRLNNLARNSSVCMCEVKARMKEHLQAIVTVLSLVNPVICGAMFARIETNRSPVERRADAMKEALAIVVILTLAALIGTRLLDLFGVSLDAFMVAGGGVLAWMGFSMLSGHASTSPASPDGSLNPGTSLTPLILFAASPGTITGVITLSAAHARLGFQSRPWWQSRWRAFLRCWPCCS
jgi:multiple antibiotic resistance protein